MAWWLFQNVVVTALLAGIVALVCRTTRVGPVVRHALWVIVLIKFLTPPVLVWPWSAPDPLGVAALDAQRPAAAIVPTPSATMSIDATNVPAIEPRDAFVDADVSGISPAHSPTDVAAAAWPWLLAIWIAGSAWMFTLEVSRLLRVSRQISRARPGPPEIVARVHRLARELRLRAIEVIAVEGQSSPALWCVGRPRLLWPASLSVEGACLDGLLVHELAHVQRRDHLVGWIDLAAGVIWWWNPLFWYVRSALREQAELACDAWVISALPSGRRAYAESLLALSSAAVQGRSPALAAVIGIRANNRRVLERRLVMIMQGRAPLRLSIAGFVALAVMMLASLPAWATGQQQAAPAQTPPTVVAQQPVPATTATQTTSSTPSQAATPVVVKPVTVSVPTISGRPLAPVTVIRQVTPQPSKITTITSQVAPTPATPGPVFVTQQKPVTMNPSWVATPAVQRPSMMHVALAPDLPADGQELLKKFEADRDAIQVEADKKVEARRAEFVKALEALQEQYTKAGKLDEAVAIRDYIRAGAGANFMRLKRR